MSGTSFSAMRRIGIAAAMFAALGLAGCGGGTPPNSTYSAYGIGQPSQVTYGTIVSMRNVAIQGSNSGLGTLGGAAAGGVAGSFIGGNGGPLWHIIGALGGAGLGAVAGHATETAMNKGAAVEFIIRQDDGQTISVVQSNENNFQPGQRVAIIHGPHIRLAPIYG